MLKVIRFAQIVTIFATPCTKNEEAFKEKYKTIYIYVIIELSQETYARHGYMSNPINTEEASFILLV